MFYGKWGTLGRLNGQLNKGERVHRRKLEAPSLFYVLMVNR